MRKSNTDTLLGKYSDSDFRNKKKTKSAPLMATYEQRYKGNSLAKVVTEKKSVPTLDEKIKQRNFTEEHSKSPIKVHVEIGGNHYLLSATHDMSEARIRKIASVANELLTSTLDNNPGLTNSKAAILALIDCCDQLLSEKEQCNNFRTDLMYYQQQYLLDKQNESKNPTPVELLVSSKGKDNKDE